MLKSIVRNDVIHSENIAIKDDLGNSVTYEELFQEAQELRKRVYKRSLVVVLCDHSIETVKIIYKMIQSSNVLLLLDANIELEFLEKMLHTYSPKYIWCSNRHKMAGRYQEILKDGNHGLFEINREDLELHRELALLIPTSGSTGSPKLVKISYENLYNNGKYMCLRCGIDEKQKGITKLPVNYIYGISFCLWHWRCGATLLITEKSIISKEFSEFYIREQANNFAAAPHSFQMLDRIKFWDEKKLSFLNFAMSGGARMPENLAKKMIDLMGMRYWVAYGQSECSIISASNFPLNLVKLNSVGRPLDDISVMIDKDNEELLVKSKSVCMGYAYSLNELQQGDINKGELRTGDAAMIDDDGYIYLKGRLDRYIKVLGNRLSLDEIQKFLQGKLNNHEFVCTGSDDKINIYYLAEREVDLYMEVVNCLHKINIPRKFIRCFCLKEFPRNKSGKILYAMLDKE